MRYLDSMDGEIGIPEAELGFHAPHHEKVANNGEHHEEKTAQTNDLVAQKPKIVETVHRAGFAEKFTQNSIHNLEETLIKRGAGGVEIDLMFTADGVPVINHDGKAAKMTFAEYQQAYPDHLTFDGLLNWWKANSDKLKGKTLWVDGKVQDAQKFKYDKASFLGKSEAKPPQIDAYKFIEKVAALGENVTFSSKDPEVIAKLILAKRLLGAKTQVSLAVPDPWDANATVRLADNLIDVVGLRDVAETGSKENQELLEDFKPDMLNFYWPEDLMKEAQAESDKSGDIVMASDPDKPESSKIYEGPHKIKPVLLRRAVGRTIERLGASEQRFRLKNLVRLAHERGYKVMAGSTGSKSKMNEMIHDYGLEDSEITNEYRAFAEEKGINLKGVDGVMPNNPDNIPDQLREQREAEAVDNGTQAEAQQISREEQFANDTQLLEGNLEQEAEDRFYKTPSSQFNGVQNEIRDRYLMLAKKTHSTNLLRQQFAY